MINFKNKNILITGASGSIGNELVKKFITLGANVLATGTKSEKLDTIKTSNQQKNLTKTENKKTTEKWKAETSKITMNMVIIIQEILKHSAARFC